MLHNIGFYSTTTSSGITISLELPLKVPASARGRGALGRGLREGGNGGKGGSGGVKGARIGGALTGVRGALFTELFGGTTTTEA